MEKEQFDLEKSELQKSMEIADIFQNPLWDYIGCIFPIGGITATFRKQYENALEEKRRGFLKEICETSCCIVETDIRSFDYISDLKLGIDAIERALRSTEHVDAVGLIEIAVECTLVNKRYVVVIDSHGRRTGA